ncbi:unnamed protein product, partial [Ectocarpus fasciculatus]
KNGGFRKNKRSVARGCTGVSRSTRIVAKTDPLFPLEARNKLRSNDASFRDFLLFTMTALNASSPMKLASPSLARLWRGLSFEGQHEQRVELLHTQYSIILKKCISSPCTFNHREEF